MFTTLIEAAELVANYQPDSWVIVDCRFALASTDAGRQMYLDGHIPGAVYAHLDNDLSGRPVTDHGRHPLPSPDAMRALFGRLGIDDRKQVVVYDNASGKIASRLWWMLRYMGHEAAAVLNGGIQSWPGEMVAGTESASPTTFNGEVQTDRMVQISQVDELPLLIDSRAPARYRGEVEPLDPHAGHIPSAKNFFFENNLGSDGRFLPVEQLRQQFSPLFESTEPSQSTFYCGSGVTACVNILAATHAGYSLPRLYVGSWSEWCRTPDRPQATGTE